MIGFGRNYYASDVYGMLGDGGADTNALPSSVCRGQIGSRTIKTLDLGYHGVALADNYIYSWGTNRYGQVSPPTYWGYAPSKFITLLVTTSYLSCSHKHNI
jgi:alpha-tubulin suppressor-like RCC1 family protein